MTAFQPEAITVEDILKQRNAALRRVMLERFGFERFMNSVNAEILDKDSDPGGDRRLLRCNFINDEGLVCLQVRCPSTTAVYVLRVPPEMRTCRQAAAWIAGFDDAQVYEPLVET